VTDNFDFHVVPGSIATEILRESRDSVMDVIRRTYILHDQGATVNPDSYFLRFPEDPASRVIALPARLAGEVRKIGIKWISSFPENVARGIPRAAAVLILNDYDTGYPVACLESAGISAARTAASAATAAEVILGRTGGPAVPSVSFVGAGVIARTIFDYLRATGLLRGSVSCFDIDPSSVDQFTAYGRRLVNGPVAACSRLDDALRADVVVFATTAARPYVPAWTGFRPQQLILNISLRDLPPEILLAANNVVDDVEHCLKADTSPHLAEQVSGSRDFITGTLGEALQDRLFFDPDRPTVFSPFGLGVLDIAVGDLVLERALASGRALAIAGFFGETRRW
jgi:2,3-diaminopropionate biosynthesis protein SbnB